MEESEKLQSSLTDLKARSMHDNLVFAGIPEDYSDDTEAFLQEFSIENTNSAMRSQSDESTGLENGTSLTNTLGKS